MHRLILILILLLGMLVAVPPLHAKETVLWRVIDWPPFYILDGPNKGEGLYDQLIDIMAKKMPEYEHKRIVASTDRVRKEWEMGTNICHPSVIPGEYSVHSVMNSILPTHRLIINESKAHLFKDRTISLDTLLADKSLKGGITPSRYSDAINKIVDKHLLSGNLAESPLYKNMIKMLLEDRIDYIIEYPVIVDYIARTTGLPNTTRSYHISETENAPFIFVVTGCTPNAWGRKMIERINTILKEEAQYPEFLSQRLYWFDRTDRTELEEIYEAEYFKDKK